MAFPLVLILPTSVINQHMRQALLMWSPIILYILYMLLYIILRIRITQHKVVSVKIKVLQTVVSYIRWSEKAFIGTEGGSCTRLTWHQKSAQVPIYKACLGNKEFREAIRRLYWCWNYPSAFELWGRLTCQFQRWNLSFLASFLLLPSIYLVSLPQNQRPLSSWYRYSFLKQFENFTLFPF